VLTDLPTGDLTIVGNGIQNAVSFSSPAAVSGR
jgi:hypothetical protein